MTNSADSSSHASRLAQLRLRAIVGVRSDVEVSEFGQAVGLVVDDVAWVYVTGRHERSLGPALMWALRNDANALKLFSSECAGDLARISTHFDFVIEVFEVDAAGVARVAGPKIEEKIEVSVADEMFAEFIKSAGADVVREHGVISGEVCGLEVCRVVRATDSGEFGGAGESGEASDSELEIGVGAHDRETFKLLHGRTATIESLRKVIAEVAARRAVGAQVHPLNRLARERMLRHYVCQSPQLVGAKSLQVAQPPIVRTNLKDVVPCCAVGVSLTGEKMIVIFNVGVDPDVVSFGADARGQINGSAELIFAMPTRDIMPAVERVAQMLRRPARFVGVDVIESSFKP
jgi:tetrahydromethanopterin S-methyltransferase subunit G